MRDSIYVVDDWDHCFGHVIEECGELVAAAGKTLRWGLESVNPELPLHDQETNLDWLKRELSDLKAAIERLEKVIAEGRV